MKNNIDTPLLGFIGQGFIGKNYADDFEKRGFRVVRYSMEKPHIGNKEKIKECDIVFIAVPTPTTPEGFDFSIVESVIPLVGTGKTGVIKSTMVPGTTKALQMKFPDRILHNSPEFLSEATAAKDAAYPFSNIVGMSADNPLQRSSAEKVLGVLPKAPFNLICDSTQSELIKYAHNMSGYFQIVLFNMLYDVALRLELDWEPVRQAVSADPMICNRYANPVHKSGRGAGGNCFIKDFAAFKEMYRATVPDPLGLEALEKLERKNIDLLKKSAKDINLLKGVYGDTI